MFLLGNRLVWPKATVFEIVIISSNLISPAKNQVESKSHKVSSRLSWNCGSLCSDILRQPRKG